MISSQGPYRQGLGRFSQPLGRQALGPFLQRSQLRLSTVLSLLRPPTFLPHLLTISSTFPDLPCGLLFPFPVSP